MSIGWPRRYRWRRSMLLATLALLLEGTLIGRVTSAGAEPDLAAHVVRARLPNEQPGPARRLGIHVWLPSGPVTGPLPPLVYAHGWGGRARENADLLRTLADQGFVVIGIDFPAPGFAGLDFRSELAGQRTRLLAEGEVRLQAGDIQAALDWLADTGRALLPGDCADRLDPHLAGVLGYSFGAAATAEAASADRRIRAVLNLDGWLFGNPAAPVFSAPYMVITDSLDPPSAEALAGGDPGRRAHAIQDAQDSDRQLRQLRSGGFAIEIPHATHESFSGADGDPEIRSVISAYAAAFFARSLRGSAAEISEATHPSPGIRFRAWPHSAEDATLFARPLATSAIMASSRRISR
ncbi:MAG: hypothetical protein INR70_22865 [Parafilimonas terrae]|nr:hypothetical protein [Parafilimonas terrae]